MTTPVDGSTGPREIETLVRARYPILYIVSWEEQRVVDGLRRLAAGLDKRLIEWSFVSGFRETAPDGTMTRARGGASRDPVNALDEVLSGLEPALYVFKDLHPFLNRSNVAAVRKLREVAMELRDSAKTLILLSPTLELAPELEKEVTVLDFPLPRADELATLLGQITAELAGRSDIAVELDANAREQLTRAALGLTLGEAENVFAKILVEDRRLTIDDIDKVLAEKRQVVRRNGLLDFCDSDVGLDAVGGLDNLKTWLRQRTTANSDRARAFGLPPPRGLFLLGVQGCGKSLSARAVANLWRMPLLRLDVGRLFGSLVGASEDNMRRALQTAESIAPVVLWIDEIDKALAGSGSSAGSDGGTTARVFGTFLTWMSEKTSSVFVVATANSVAALPPELVRKGRFDEIFFVDLPTRREREEVFAIQLARRQRDPATFDLVALAHTSAGFSGAEIEEAVTAGLYDAFASDGELTTAILLEALAATVPLSKTMETELQTLRQWADSRARWATPREVRAVAAGGARRLDL